MAIGVQIVPNKATDKLSRMAAQTRPALRNTINRIVIRAESEVVKRTPVGAFNALRGGYATDPATIARLQGAVVNPILYHDWVEEGRNPGRMPPVQALVPWVGVKLGVPVEARHQVAFLVARAIGARGTQPAGMVKAGWAATKRHIRPELKKAGLQIRREFTR